jgi:hypothetical protein
MLSQLLSLEMLPSTLAVVALLVFIAGKYKQSICRDNSSCTSILDNSNTIAIASLAFAVVLVVLICCGFVTLSGSMGSGMYGGYGGGSSYY